MQTQELEFKVIVDPKFPQIQDGVVCFETGATPEQRGLGVYEHHGVGFNQSTTGALTRLFEDLITGTPLPLVFATHSIGGPDTLLAITLFMDRRLLMIPATTGLVYGVDLAHRFGPQLLAHLDPMVAGFFRSFPKFFQENNNQREQGERIAALVQWVREYLIDGKLPNLGSPLPEVRVLDWGTNGFVLADTDNPSIEAWEVLYRAGHLRGLLLGPDSDGTRIVVASRKNERSWPSLHKAVAYLNDLESLSDGDPSWRFDGDFLHSPSVGTRILPSHMLKVFLGI